MKNNILGTKKKFGSKNLKKFFDLENKYLFQVYHYYCINSLFKYLSFIYLFFWLCFIELSKKEKKYEKSQTL
jgi:hypothetical protein